MRWAGVLACALLLTSAAASSAQAAGLGIESYALTATEENGSADRQAGSHPYELSAEAAFDGTGGALDGLRFELPPGVVINPDTVAPLLQCTTAEFITAGCSNGAAVGVAMVSAEGKVHPAAVYDLASEPEVPARLGFIVDDVRSVIDVVLRPGDDGATLNIKHTPQIIAPTAIKLELWGDPGDSHHDALRGRCATGEETVCTGGASPAAFVTLPTSCTSALDASTTALADSWQDEAEWASASSSLPQMTGCDQLPFGAALSVVPQAAEADVPSGYQVQLSMPQNEGPEGLATAQVRDASVTLPAGASLSLLTAGGLTGCEEAQVSPDSSEPAVCANSSKVGLVKIDTPLLAHPLEGAVFFATPNANPLGAPVALYVVAEEPVSGTRIKLAGQVALNQATGQPTLTFDELPQLPIGDIELELFGGPRALLANPPTCGLATSTSELTPWSGTAGVTASSAFKLNSGVEGTPCFASQPFSPIFLTEVMVAGETDAYGSLSVFVSRADSEQQLSAIAIQAPPAVAQMFAGVPACEEPQASEGACPAASEVGTVAAQAGLGYDPADLNGTVYLTGPYDGAAQGLEVVLPVDPGPFELGTVLVRASLRIEPSTGRLSIASGPLPSLADGVPLQLKALVLQLDSGEFRIDPESCESLTVTGTITGAQGGAVTVVTEPLGAASSPCPPPPQQAPSPAESGVKGTVSSTATVSLAGIRIVTSRRGRAAVKLRCEGTGGCRGKLTLTARAEGRSGHARKRGGAKTTIATATFSIPAGKTATVWLELDASGRVLLSVAHGQLNASLAVLKSSPAPSQRTTDGVRLVQHPLADTAPRQDPHDARLPAEPGSGAYG